MIRPVGLCIQSAYRFPLTCGLLVLPMPLPEQAFFGFGWEKLVPGAKLRGLDSHVPTTQCCHLICPSPTPRPSVLADGRTNSRPDVTGCPFHLAPSRSCKPINL